MKHLNGYLLCTLDQRRACRKWRSYLTKKTNAEAGTRRHAGAAAWDACYSQHCRRFLESYSFAVTSNDRLWKRGRRCYQRVAVEPLPAQALVF